MATDRSSLVRNSAIVFGGNAVANVANYLYNIIMARFLGPELFAALVALLATMTIVGIPAMAILFGFTTFAADLQSEGSLGKLRYLWISGLQIVGLLGGAVALVAILLTDPILNFLHIGTKLPFILLMLSIPIGLLVAVNRGIVQGLERFGAYATSIGSEGISKVVLGTLFVWLGYQLIGATAGILAASIVAFVVLLPSLKPLAEVAAEPFPRRQLLGFSIFTLFVTVVITLFLNVDVIAAKAFLPADVAGRYAAASTAAKIIPYVVSAVVNTMMPRIAQLVTRKERHTGVLIEGLALTAIGGLGIYGIYLLAPEFVLGLLYGSLYIDASHLLAVLGGAMLLYAVANVLLTYFLSTKDGRVGWALGSSGIGLFVLLGLYHSTAEQLAGAMLGSSLILLLSVGLTYVWLKRERLSGFLVRH